jgi:HK97 family phage major capsid protein
MECQQCGRGFRHVRSDARYCSDACRQAAHRARKAMTTIDVANLPRTREEAEDRYFDSVLAAADRQRDAAAAKARGDAEHRAVLQAGLDDIRALRHAAHTEVAATKAFLDWVRNGPGGLDTEAKAALVLDATGMTLVPVDIAVEALNIARAGVFRSLASVRPTNRTKHRAGLLTAASVGWGRLETGATLTDANTVPEGSGTPQEVEVQDLLALCLVGVDELDDSVEAARAAIVEAVGNAIRDAEDTAFAVGTGSDQPQGIVNATNLARIPSGNKIAAASSNVPTWAQVTSLPGLVADRYRDNGVFVMHPTSATKIAGLAEAHGGAFEPGPRGRGLHGYPVRQLSALPDPATAGTTQASILFGDFGAAYRIADRDQGRISVRLLRESFAVAGKRGFLVKVRVGGDLLRPAALAVYTQ